jgi:hypothetical protein
MVLAGSAVYIFGIDQAISQPNIAFTLGSIQQVHHYTGTERFVYDALFFSATGLASDQTHTVNWVFNFANTDVEVQAALFDYAVVTSGGEDVKTTSTPVTTGYVFLSSRVSETEFYADPLLLGHRCEFRKHWIHVTKAQWAENSSSNETA